MTTITALIPKTIQCATRAQRRKQEYLQNKLFLRYDLNNASFWANRKLNLCNDMQQD